jgi:hypothetical protein
MMFNVQNGTNKDVGSVWQRTLRSLQLRAGLEERPQRDKLRESQGLQG